jgi:hypothetical protein
MRPPLADARRAAVAAPFQHPGRAEVEAWIGHSLTNSSPSDHPATWYGRGYRVIFNSHSLADFVLNKEEGDDYSLGEWTPPTATVPKIRLFCKNLSAEIRALPWFLTMTPMTVMTSRLT